MPTTQVYDFGNFGTSGGFDAVESLSSSPSSGGFLDYARGGLSLLGDATLLGLNAYGTFQQVRSGAATGATPRGPEYVYDPIPALPTDGTPQFRQSSFQTNLLLIGGLAIVAAVLLLRK